ncbi:MAG: hypothetical protein IPP88_07595 [Betaproteobacteria bacterium]|nr:hypothetical protein [Betaproteobacteria bacterium]
MNSIKEYWLTALSLVMVACAVIAVLVWGNDASDSRSRSGAVGDDANREARAHEHQSDAKAREVERRFKEAVLMLHAKQYEHALTALHRVLEFAPAMPEAHANMGYTMLGLKRFVAARDFFSSAIELRPMQANAYYGLALAFEAENDRARAIGAMRSFVHLAKPDDPFVRKARAALWEWQSASERSPAGDQSPSFPGRNVAWTEASKGK